MASSLLWGFYKMQRNLLTNTYKIVKKNTLAGKKEGRGKNYGRFLKMIDDLQTPKHKTNHKYRSYFPLLSFIIEIKPTIKSKQM
jgi:hypothetical protein